MDLAHLFNCDILFHGLNILDWPCSYGGTLSLPPDFAAMSMSSYTATTPCCHFSVEQKYSLKIITIILKLHPLLARLDSSVVTAHKLESWSLGIQKTLSFFPSTSVLCTCIPHTRPEGQCGARPPCQVQVFPEHSGASLDPVLFLESK